jgi:phage tail-like protein
VPVHKEEIATLLPGIFQRTIDWEQPDNVLAAMLSVMEQMHRPTETILDNLDSYFHPDLAPDTFVPFLAHWVGLGPLLPVDDSLFPSGINRLRDLVWAAVSLAQRRGTRESLIMLLQTATGLKGFNVYEHQDRPLHIVVVYPSTAGSYLPLLKKIIALEKPVFVTYELQEGPG